MNRKNKVIVSIVGITIVLLALLGITYAYYLTRIEGNTNTNSISITTADLKLVYRDGNGAITKENIMPGTTIEKTFTVENTGNNKVDNYAVYLEEVVNTLSRTEDLTYVLECVSTSGECNGGSGEFPQLAEAIIVNSIEKNVTHTYTLTVTYANLDDVNQSDDMGSTISAFVQIYAMKDILDIEGVVENHDDGDYAQINSVQKRSQIVEGNYKFAGVLPGTHTIKICDKEDETCSSPKLSQQITVNVGTTSGVNGNAITMTESSQTANININVTGQSIIIGTEIKEEINLNPFNSGTLAYEIVNNALNITDEQRSLDYAEYRDEPLTIPGIESIEYIVEGEKNFLSNFPGWNWATYGDTAEDAKYNYTKVPGDTDYEKCMNSIGKFISDSYHMYNGDYYGKVLECSDDGKPYVAVFNTEASLLAKEDDYKNSYYFRGNVQNNYINFAGMCWRIVRIQGDGSIKLVLEDKNTGCENTNGNFSIGEGNFGYTSYPPGELNEREVIKIDYLHGETDFDNSMANILKRFQQNEMSSYLNKLKSGDWCISSNAYSKTEVSSNNYIFSPLTEEDILSSLTDASYFNFYYESYKNIFHDNSNITPTFKCNGNNMNNFEDNNNTLMYLGVLTADEITFASGRDGKGYYINNAASSNYYTTWTLSPQQFDLSYTGDMPYFVFPNGQLGYSANASNYFHIRPAVILKPNINISSGDGTINNPYVIG